MATVIPWENTMAAALDYILPAIEFAFYAWGGAQIGATIAVWVVAWRGGSVNA